MTTSKDATLKEDDHKVWPGAFAAYRTALRQIKKNPGPALLFIGVYALFSVISSIAQGGKLYADPAYAPYEDAAILIFLLALPVYGLALADGRKIHTAEFMRFNASKYFSISVAVILYCFIVGLSLLLLIIPVIWTAAWYAFEVYPIADRGTGPVAALKRSKQLAERHKAKVWRLIGVGILVSILVSLPALALANVPYVGGIASVFAMASYIAITSVSGAILYRWLERNTEQLDSKTVADAAAP
ncbi:MAG: hypothetical protein M3R63_10835 [Actinomycetota bacterium]|jgi:hypothetical protein|nr:hypothetical protein [Actinomycetota bacterium]